LLCLIDYKDINIINILLIDADSVIPNLALMKLSQYYKQLGYNVKLRRLNIPYYPNRKKFTHIINSECTTFCSCIYLGNTSYIRGNIIFGGTGYSLNKDLPDNIESINPDYSIYDTDTSYGFLTRGCIRKCSYCVVPEKEGYIRQVATVDQIVVHKKVYFLDNNILAFRYHYNILKELIDKGIKCKFGQGLDIRLVNKNNSHLLSKLRYLGEYTFAFDNIKYLSIVEDKLKLLSWRNEWQIKFFIFIHPNMSIVDTVKRIEWCRVNKCLPYIMRDISCWKSIYNKFYIDLAAWCNQPNLFKCMTFSEFLDKRHKDKNRIQTSNNLYKEG